jgi:hypothetical protein
MDLPLALRASQRRLAGAFLAFSVAWLSACSTIEVASDPLKKPPTADQSVVVVSLTGNTSQVGVADTITVTRRNPADPKAARESFVLNQVAAGMARDTALYVGTLPVGEYTFNSLGFSATRQYLLVTDAMRARIGAFAVAGGKAADLGRLVMTPVNTGLLIGRSQRATSNLELVQRFAPEYLKFFDRPDVALGWQGPRSANDAVEAYAMATPVGADSPFELADGSVVMGARLGAALVRSPEGKWRAIRSEGLEALLCVRPGDTPENHLVAVGEFGTLLRAAQGSEKFVKVDPGNLPPGNLLFVAGNARTGWLVVHQAGREIQFLRSPTLEAGQWAPVRRFTLQSSVWSGSEQLWLWTNRAGLGYAAGDSGLHFLDMSTGVWRDRPAPSGHRIIGVAPDQREHIGILTSPGGGFAGVFAGQYFTKDAGLRWQEVKTEFKVKVGPPRRLKNGELLIAGGVFSSPELHASADEGKTWQKRSDFKLDQHLTVLPSGLLLAASRGTFGLFDIAVSKDDGKTWRVEYSNFDRQAYEARQQRP